jgi:branched-chain amino acid transport system substrate-binding protein
MRSLWIIVSVVVVVIAAIFVGIRLTQKPTPQEQVIRIGAILPLTGKLSFLGEPEKNALILAMYNLKHKGVNIQVKFYDSQGDPKTAVSVIQKAVSADGIKVFLASLSGVCMALKPVAESQDIFLGAVAFHPEITINAKHTVRFLYDGKREAEKILDIIIKEKPNLLFILASRDPLSEVQVRDVLRPGLSKAKIDFQEEWFELGTKDYRSQIAKLRSVSPSLVVVLGYGSDIKLLLSQMLEQNVIISLKVIGGIGCLELKNQVPFEAIKNVVFIGPKFIAENSQAFQELCKQFKNRWGIDEVPYDAAYMYDALHILAECLAKDPQKTPESLRSTLLSRKFMGVTGPLSFDKMGNLQSELAIMRYKKKFELLIVNSVKEGQQ